MTDAELDAMIADLRSPDTELFDVAAAITTLREQVAAKDAEIATLLANAKFLLAEGIRLEADNAALRQQIANAIRLYPQLAERITSSTPDPSFGNPRTP